MSTAMALVAAYFAFSMVQVNNTHVYKPWGKHDAAAGKPKS